MWGSAGVIKHEVQFYEYLKPYIKELVNKIILINIKEEEFDNIILTNLNHIVYLTQYKNIEKEISGMLPTIRDLIAAFNKIGIEAKIEIEVKFLTMCLGTKRGYLKVKEEFEKIINKSIHSLSRVSLCILFGLFAYQSYNRLIHIYFNKNDIKKKEYFKKSFNELIKKNITYALDSLIFILGSYYLLKTPTILNTIWQKKTNN